MPNYRGHLIGGAVVFAAGTYLLKSYDHTLADKPLFVGMLGVATALGCLFPDIDTKSKGQRIFYMLTIPPLTYSLAYQRWNYMAALLSAMLIPLIARHRGITHQAWFLIAFPAVALFLIHHYVVALSPHMVYVYFFFVAGALSHIVLDKTVSALKKF